MSIIHSSQKTFYSALTISLYSFVTALHFIQAVLSLSKLSKVGPHIQLMQQSSPSQMNKGRKQIKTHHYMD